MIDGLHKDYYKSGKLIIEEHGMQREMTDEEAVLFLKFKMWLNGGCTVNETTVWFEGSDD